MYNTADTYILDIPYQADNIYTYSVPDELLKNISPGTFIHVPFGPSNRIRTAVVTSVSEGTEEDVSSLKEISGIPGLQNDLRLSRQQLDLCFFLKEHTLCTFGEAVKCMVPPGFLKKRPDYYTLGPDAEVNDDDGSPESEVLRYISEAGRPTLRNITGRFGDSAKAIVKGLVRRGIISAHAELPGVRKVVSTVTVYSLCPGADLSSVRGKRQTEVTQALKNEPEISKERIAAVSGCSPDLLSSPLLSLEKKGIIRKEERVVSREKKDHGIKDPGFTLSEEQAAAFDRLSSFMEDASKRVALLHGVTGSGKTNVMISLIGKTLSDGRGVVMMVPEISLTPQTTARFRRIFGDNIAIIHSGLTSSERTAEWMRIYNGEARIVVGTRSAVFAPVKDPGLFIIDEEHESTYRSESDPKYLAHEVAGFRCMAEDAHLILASATPSVRDYYYASTGKYELVRLKERYGGAKIPEVRIIDMRHELETGNTSPFSSFLIDRIGNETSRGKQSILFLNRRGYNSVVTCRTCGSSIVCPNCSVTMTYHISASEKRLAASAEPDYLYEKKLNGYLCCHICGHREQVPDSCPECGGRHIAFTGKGTQLIEDELHRLLPDLRILRMDYDTTRTKQAYDDMLGSFRRHEYDVLLGTQMISKGHDFPEVTTVGVINSDYSLYLNDYKANENTFSMLTQVIGRSGRGKDEGLSVIQTFKPDNDIIALAAMQDYESFYSREIKIRKSMVFPPFCNLAVLTMSDISEDTLGKLVTHTGNSLASLLKGEFSDVKVIIYGPVEPQVYKLQNVFRKRFIIKCKLNKRTRELFSALLKDFSSEKSKISRHPDRSSVSVEFV